MQALIMAAQLILGLAILVTLHELGHFLAARAFGIRVEKFYLFFDPWFSLVKKKVGETEYGVGWLPLGGYVKISGMVDESMDKEAMKLPPKPWEFRSKPAWQRLIIMLAGITMNVLLAFFIYAMILFKWGDSRVPASSLKYGIAFNDSLFYNLGFKDGDKILAVDDKPIEEYADIVKKILLVNKTVTIERDSQRMTLNMPPDILGKLSESDKKRNNEDPLISPRMPVLLLNISGVPLAEAQALRSKGDLYRDYQKTTSPFIPWFPKKITTIEIKKE